MSCKTLHFNPECNYNTSGIVSLKLIDKRKVAGYKVQGAKVTEIYYDGEVIDIPVNVTTKYNSTDGVGIKRHTVSSFLLGLSDDNIDTLQRATSGTFVVIFTTASAQTLIFGLDSGAKLRYKLTTEDNSGGEMAIVADSEVQIYGLEAGAINGKAEPTRWVAVYDTKKQGCQILDGEVTGVKFALYLKREGVYTGAVVTGATGKTQILLPSLADPADYSNFEIVGRFEAGELVDGYATAKIDTTTCDSSLVWDWVLTGGVWDMAGFWYNSELWEFKND